MHLWRAILVPDSFQHPRGNVLTESSYKCGVRYKSCLCEDNDDNVLAADENIDIPAVVAAMNQAERQEEAERAQQQQMQIDYDYQRMTDSILQQQYREGQQVGEVRDPEHFIRHD